MENAQWDGNHAAFVDLARPALAGPGAATYRASGSMGDTDLAVASGAQVILSGDGGDQLGTPTGVTDDTIRNRPIGYVLETLRRSDLSGARRVMRFRRLLRQVAPLSWRRWLATGRYRSRLPSWLQPRWHGLADSIVSSFYPSGFERSFDYRVQGSHFHDLTSGRTAASLDAQQRTGGTHGVEFRFPFLDQDLVEFVLSIPPQFWPADGPGARLHRDALGELLPPELRARRDKAAFSGAVGWFLHHAAPELRALFHEGEWCSSTFVVRSEAQALLKQALGASLEDPQANWRVWIEVRAIATFEAWLRTILGYHSGGERTTHDGSTQRSS